MSLLAAVPGDAFGVAFVDVRRPVWDALTGGLLIPLPADRKRKLDAELKALLAETIGIDPSGAVAAVAFMRETGAGGKPTGALLVKSIGGTLRGAQAAGGLSLKILDADAGIVAALSGDILAVGPESGVRAAFDVLSGKDTNLAKANAPFAAWIAKEAAGAYLAAVVWAPALKSPAARAQAAQFGLERGLWSATATSIKLLVVGDKDKLATVVKMSRAAIGAGVAQADRAHAQIAGADPMTRMMVALQYHYMHGVAETVVWKPTADGLRVDLPLRLDGAGIALPVVGVLAAVAIPAFMKYIRKSKTTEARELTYKLYSRGADVRMNGKPFPPNVGPTPPLGTCCKQGGKCAPNAQQWAHSSWAALQFSVDDPHYYSYEWKTDGKRFTVLAYGDLDCDGKYSTFEIEGEVDARGQISAKPSLRRYDQLE